MIKKIKEYIRRLFGQYELSEEEKVAYRQWIGDLHTQWQENCKTDPSLNDPLDASEKKFAQMLGLTDDQMKARRLI